MMSIRNKFSQELAMRTSSGETDSCPFAFTGDACRMSWDKCSKCGTYVKHLEEEGYNTDSVWNTSEDNIKRAIAAYLEEAITDVDSGEAWAMCPFSMFEVPCDRAGYMSCKQCAERFTPIE